MKKQVINMKNFIYILRDPGNNEVVYVGKTKDPKKRHKDHCRKCRGKFRSLLDKWKNDIIDDGKIPIMEIIKECHLDDVDYWEKYYILEYRRIGTILNMTDGGDGLQNPSEEVRTKIGLKSKGRIPSKETRSKLSLSHYNSGKKIICYNNNKILIGEFPNARRASESLNVGFKNISKILRGNEYFIKGYTFFLDTDIDDIEARLSDRIMKTTNMNKSFHRVSKNGELKIYDNILEAARENNCNFRNIWLCLTGGRKICAGFAWVYNDSFDGCHDPFFIRKTNAKNIKLISKEIEYNFKSIDEASSKLNIHKSNICQYLKKKVKPRNGDVWEYVID